MTTHIDVTDYVEAETGRGSLQFSDEKQQARFALGVCMYVYRWDALSIAVENNWGGPQSAEKRDWVSSILLDLFKNERIVDVTLIEETLLFAMADEFETNVEDDSALPIAAGIINLYRQCEAGNYNEVDQMYAQWQANKQNQTSRKVQVVADPHNPDISESEDDDNCDEEDEEMGDADEGEAQARPVPELDEDGFEIVKKSGRRRH
ncbi:AER119Wp [Eremothecium gossypii ATCC 10895]|uniref:AER119Wp n=1 Tax=Eremothecium gossypii (strain ATCC 10895 / CBS 109.51 / FGSC 9923 / NRRL Y-1056) TaxID=284811 RepID=Q756Z4_EREGS|nr:AER119Wp [Eremothecium gossypii ATCC 10895]AAS52803.1 AER119Wp [Eremothecium gossypii ATCC 10895]AEY97109.1 FAER119Wp [Eremothecium gossypii FDAG1]